MPIDATSFGQQLNSPVRAASGRPQPRNSVITVDLHQPLFGAWAGLSWGGDEILTARMPQSVGGPTDNDKLRSTSAFSQGAAWRGGVSSSSIVSRTPHATAAGQSWTLAKVLHKRSPSTRNYNILSRLTSHPTAARCGPVLIIASFSLSPLLSCVSLSRRAPTGNLWTRAGTTRHLSTPFFFI